jgi:hypothetical protein
MYIWYAHYHVPNVVAELLAVLFLIPEVSSLNLGTGIGYAD